MMNRRALFLLACFGGVQGVAPTMAEQPLVSPGFTMSNQVLAELNRARANPTDYAASLREYRQYYHNDVIVEPGSDVAYATQEGVAPVDEAITFLDHEERRPVLAEAKILADAASDHTAAQASDGSVGHYGRDGLDPGKRVRDRGGDIFVAEVIAYGSSSAADMVRQLIVDDGVPDRGHRRLIFASDLRFAGVSCGSHPTYRTMCVVDLARTPDGRARDTNG